MLEHEPAGSARVGAAGRVCLKDGRMSVMITSGNYLDSGSSDWRFDDVDLTPRLIGWRPFAVFYRGQPLAIQSVSDLIWNQSWPRLAELARAFRRSELA